MNSSSTPALTAKTSAYHRLSRTAKLRKNLCGSKDIAYSTNGVQPRLVRVDLGAQTMHQDIDHVGLGIEAVIEDVLENHRLGHGAAGVPHQVFEQGEFARLQFHLLTGARHGACEQVESQIANGQAGRLGSLRGAADQSVQAGGQFGEGKRLGQIIVTAGLQPFDAVVQRGFGAENDDGRADFLAAQALDQTQAVELGQHDIDHGGVV